MAKFKKLAMLCTALLATASMATFAACDLFAPPASGSSSSSTPSESSSVEESSSEEDSSSEDGGDIVEVATLALGENTVNATKDGVPYLFTASAVGTFKITWTDANAKVFNKRGVEITSGTEFTLDDPELLSVSFNMATVDETDASYVVTIETVTVVEEETPTIAIGGSAEVSLKQADFFEGVILLDNVPAGSYQVSISGAELPMGIDALNDMDSYDEWGPELNADNNYTGVLEITEGYNVSLKVYFLGDTPTADTSVTVTLTEAAAEPTALVYGDNTLVIDEAAVEANGAEFIFTAVDAATYVFSSTSEALTVECDAFPKGKGGMSVPLAPGFGSASVEVPLSAGQVITLIASAEGETGEFDLNIAKKPADFVVGDNTIAVTAFDVENYGVVCSFTAPDAGTYVFSATDENINVECDAFPGNPRNPMMSMPLAPAFGVSSAEVTLEKDQVITLIVTSVNYEADEFELAIAKKPVALNGGDNTIKVTAFDVENYGAVYTFTAPDAATYVFSATDENINVECDAFPSNPRNPMMSMPLAPAFGVSSAEVTLEKDQVITLIVTSVNYEADEFELAIAKKPVAISIGNNTVGVTAFDVENYGAVYTFTAPEAATYVFAGSDANLNVECDAFPGNPRNPMMSMPLAPAFGVSSAEVTLEKDQTITLIVTSVDYEADEFTLAIGQKLTVGEALAKASALDNYVETEVYYYIEGVIVDITSDMYGNMLICDENGNVMATWGMYSADGSVRFDAMDPQPKVGDKIAVLSHLKNHNAPQIQNPKLQVLTAQDMPAEYKVFAEGYALSTTTSISAAGDVTVATVGETYDNVTIAWASSDTAVAAVNGGIITYTLPAEATTVTLTATVTDGTTTKAYTFEVKVSAAPKANETTVSFAASSIGPVKTPDVNYDELDLYYTDGKIAVDDVISISASKETASTPPRYHKDGQIRLYAGNTFTISCATGYKVTSVEFTTTSEKFTTSTTMVNATATGLGTTTVTLTPSGTGDIVITSSKAFITNIVFTYEKVEAQA